MAFSAAAVAAVLANTQGQDIWAAVLVLIVAVWVLDIGSAFAARGRIRLTRCRGPRPGLRRRPTSPVEAGTPSLVIAVVVGLGWAVAFLNTGKWTSSAPLLMVALLAGLGMPLSCLPDPPIRQRPAQSTCSSCP